MPHQHLIAYMKNNEIFNKYFKDEIQQIYDSFGSEDKNNLFTYKTHKMENTYRKDEFYIVDIKEPIEYDDLKKLPKEPRLFLYSTELTYLSGKVFQTEDYVDTMDILEYIYGLDAEIGNKMINSYHNMCASNKEVQQFGESIFVIQKVLETYLKENNFYQSTVEINYDPNDPQSVTNWFQNVDSPDYDQFPRYNDGDYTQFLFKGKDGQEYHIVEDVASDNLFIYKSLNYNSGSWYMTSRNDFKGVTNDMHDALFESRQYISKNIEENLNQFTLIGQYENGIVVKATTRLDDLNLVQGYIYGQLYVEGKLKLDVNDSFSYMLANYRQDHDYYKHDLDEVHFFSFLKEIKENPGSLYYHNYQYYSNHDNNPNLDHVEDNVLKKMGDSKDYQHLQKLSPIVQEQIAQYIEEKMERFSSNEKIKSHLTAIKNALSNSMDNDDIKDDDDIIITRRPAKEIVEEVDMYNKKTGKIEKMKMTHLK